MFSFKPNPDYVPGGVNNFWLSGSSAGGGPPNGEVERSSSIGYGGVDGSVQQGMERAGGGGFGSSMMNKKDQSKKCFEGKFEGFMEKFSPLGNTYNI